MPKYFVYSRVSTAKQDDSLLKQKEVTDRWIASNLKTRLADYVYGGDFSDEAVSGSTPILHRPAGYRMFAECKKGDMIITADFTRAFRSAADCANTIQILDAKGILLVILDPTIDLGTDTGRLIAQMLASVAEFERKTIVKRTVEAVESQQARGIFAIPPRGWMRGGHWGRARRQPGDPPPEEHPVVPDIEMRENVAMMAKLHEKSKLGWGRFVKSLRADLRRRPDGKLWTGHSLQIWVFAMRNGWPLRAHRKESMREYKRKRKTEQTSVFLGHGAQ